MTPSPSSAPLSVTTSNNYRPTGSCRSNGFHSVEAQRFFGEERTNLNLLSTFPKAACPSSTVISRQSADDATTELNHLQSQPPSVCRIVLFSVGSREELPLRRFILLASMSERDLPLCSAHRKALAARPRNGPMKVPRGQCRTGAMQSERSSTELQAREPDEGSGRVGKRQRQWL